MSSGVLERKDSSSYQLVEPVETAVVRLLSYGRTQRPHGSRKKMPHLMMLASDRIVLYTAMDDGCCLEDQGSMMEMSLSERPSLGQRSRSFMRLSSVTKHRVDAGEYLHGNSDDEDEELLAGQEFRLGVSINQILDVHVAGDRYMCIVYQPNKPSKRWISEQQGFTSFVKSISSLSGSSPTKKSDMKHFLAKYPECHHFMVGFVNSTRDAVFDFVEQLYAASERYYECIDWLGKHLPLQNESQIVMVTCGMHGSHGNQFCSPFPALGDAVQLPTETVGKAMANTDSDAFVDLVLRVYLSTPLGPATATISLMEFERSFEEGGAPVEVIASCKAEQKAPEGYFWQVSMQFQAERSEKYVDKLKIRDDSCGGEPAVDKDVTETNKVLRRKSAGISDPMLLGLVALKTGATIVKKLRPNMSQNKVHPSGKRGSKTVKVYDWSITIVEIDVTLEPDKTVGVPRMMSTSSALGTNDLLDPAATLAPPFQYMLGKYPDIVTYDVATRFIVGLESESKAYHGLNKMVEYFISHDVQNTLQSKQPAFDSMKRHYPHGLIGWSSKRDCLIEYEAMGLWPDAYKHVLADGHNEEDILKHLLFCYMFAFERIDSRAWPKGKTVKIMDIEGLQMSHLNSPGFKFITRIAGVLAVMFPQRMQQCFFVNAPSWWSMAWRLIAPMIPEKVRSQMQVFNRNNKEKAKQAMLEWIDEDSLPVKYGGKCDRDMLRDSAYEQQVVEHARTLNSAEHADILPLDTTDTNNE